MILARNVQPSIMISTPPDAAPSNAVVIGAGTAAVNGTYTYRGESEGKPYYNLEGQPDSVTASALVWQAAGPEGAAWYITNDSEGVVYDSLDDTAFPWEVVTWSDFSGDLPVPTVTQG